MSDGLAIAEENPRYWSYDGAPTLMLGGSVEDNLFQVDDVENHLDELVAVGGNYVRCTMSSRDEGDVQPFAKVDRQYRLNEWNEEYWQCLEQFLTATAERDVAVQLEFWDCWDCVEEAWAESPWNPANNETYTAAESELAETPLPAEQRFENAFFHTPPALDDNALLREHQERFFQRVLEVSSGYGHVLYSIDNETDMDPAWAEYWAAFAREREPDIFLTEMWNPWELSHPEHLNTIENSEAFDFVDVSQNNFQSGEEHWTALQSCRARVTDPIRPLNNVKVYGSDEASTLGEGSEIFESTSDGVRRFWRNIFGGCATVRFHRPPFGIGLSDLAKQHIEAARTITDELDLVTCEPHNELLAGRRHNAGSEAHPGRKYEAHVLANPGEEYGVYFPDGGSATLEPDVASMDCRWFDVEDGSWKTSVSADDGTLTTPGDGQWIALVQ